MKVNLRERQLDLMIIESNPADAYLAVQGLKQAGLAEACGL